MKERTNRAKTYVKANGCGAGFTLIELRVVIAPPSDPMKAFALCFEILTPETVGVYMDRYPYLVP